MKQKKLKAKDVFTVEEDAEIKKMIAISRAVSKERKTYIKELLKIKYGLYQGIIAGSNETLTLENYIEHMEKGTIRVIPCGH